MVKAIQEQQEIIERQDGLIAELQSAVTTLKKEMKAIQPQGPYYNSRTPSKSVFTQRITGLSARGHNFYGQVGLRQRKIQ